MDKRWAEIKAIWKKDQWLYVVAGFLLGILFQPFLASINTDLNGFLQAIVPEAIGIVFTVLIIDRLNQRREEQQLKKRLRSQLASRINSVAINAAEELWAWGWLQDGSLKGTDLSRADLRGVDFGKGKPEGYNFCYQQTPGYI